MNRGWNKRFFLLKNETLFIFKSHLVRFSFIFLIVILLLIYFNIFLICFIYFYFYFVSILNL